MNKKTFFLIFPLFFILLCGCGKNRLQLTSLDDLPNFKIAVIESTAGEIYCRTNSLDYQSFPDYPSVCEAVSNGDFDCILIDKKLAKNITELSPSLSENQTVTLPVQEYCIAVRSDDDDTKYVCEVCIVETGKNNEYKKTINSISDNIGADRDQFATKTINGTNGELILGVLEKCPPLSYSTSDGRVLGTAVEFAKKLAVKRDQTLIIKTYHSEAELMNALLYQNIDVCFLSKSSVPNEKLYETDTIFKTELVILSELK